MTSERSSLTRYRAPAALRRAAHLLTLALVALTFAQCREDVDELTVQTDPLPPTTELTTVALAGTATAPGGEPAAGATVEVVYEGRVLSAATADARGAWAMPEARVSAEAPNVTVRTRYPGAYAVVRAVPRDASTVHYASAELTALDDALVQEASAPLEMSGDGFAVSGPAGAFALDGRAYEGEVRLAMQSFDFRSLESLPQSVATPYVVVDADGGRSGLQHERVFVVEASTPDGRALALRRDGEAAAVEVTLSGGNAGATLFHFDDGLGAWTEVTPEADGALRTKDLGYYATGSAKTGESISGRVVDAAGEPLPGQTVLVVPEEEDGSVGNFLYLETDGEGAYETVVPADTRSYVIAGIRACGFDLEIYVSGDATELRDLVTGAGTLVPVSGRVTVCDGGAPIADSAYVEVAPASGSTELLPIAAVGTFAGEVRVCDGGDFSVRYVNPDIGRGSEPVTVAQSDATSITVEACEVPNEGEQFIFLSFGDEFLTFRTAGEPLSIDADGVITIAGTEENGDDGTATLTLTPNAAGEFDPALAFEAAGFGSDGAGAVFTDVTIEEITYPFSGQRLLSVDGTATAEVTDLGTGTASTEEITIIAYGAYP